MYHSKSTRPNILWICTDQQRYNTIQSLGNSYIRTPNIDRLVENGVTFCKAYAQSPICTPSRASFLTGRYPKTTRVRQNGNEYFPQDEKLVTKLIAEQGYDCGLVGKLHISTAENVEKRFDDGYRIFKWSHHPFDDWKEGHDYQDWLKSKGIEWDDHYKLECYKSGEFGDWKKILEPGEGGIASEYHQTTWCAEEAIDFMKQSRSEPWLLSVNMFDPHPPYDPPATYRDRFDVEQLPLPKWVDGELDNKPKRQKEDYLNGGQGGIGPAFSKMSNIMKKRAIADYYAMIELIDDQVGRMIDTLKETGQLENTIVIFMSDHGELTGEHGLYWKGANFYEELVHVPLIFSWPEKFKKGLKSDALVELVDIAPTLLDVMGVEIPYYMQGKSLKGILTGEKNPDIHKSHVHAEYFNVLDGTHADTFATMYRDDRYKLVVYHGEEIGELYDLQTDPDEFRNLWSDPQFERLKLKLMKKSFDSNAMIIDPKPPRTNYF